MRPQRSWPQRFRVVIHTRGGGEQTRDVVTWRGPEKAIALAVAAHLRRSPQRDDIDDVEIEDLGPVERDPQGTMVIEPRALVDRAEF